MSSPLPLGTAVLIATLVGLCTADKQNDKWSLSRDTSHLRRSLYRDITQLKWKVFSDTRYLQRNLYPDTSHLQRSLYPDTSHLQRNLYPDTSHLQRNLYPDTSHLQWSLYPDTRYLQRSLYPDTRYLQRSLYPDTRYLQRSLYPDTRYLQRSLYPDTSHLQRNLYPDISHLKRNINPETSHLKRNLYPDTSHLKRNIYPDTSYIQRYPFPDATGLKRYPFPYATQLKGYPFPDTIHQNDRRDAVGPARRDSLSDASRPSSWDDPGVHHQPSSLRSLLRRRHLDSSPPMVNPEQAYSEDAPPAYPMNTYDTEYPYASASDPYSYYSPEASTHWQSSPEGIPHVHSVDTFGLHHPYASSSYPGSYWAQSPYAGAYATIHPDHPDAPVDPVLPQPPFVPWFNGNEVDASYCLMHHPYASTGHSSSHWPHSSYMAYPVMMHPTGYGFPHGGTTLDVGAGTSSKHEDTLESLMKTRNMHMDYQRMHLDDQERAIEDLVEHVDSAFHEMNEYKEEKESRKGKIERMDEDFELRLENLKTKMKLTVTEAKTKLDELKKGQRTNQKREGEHPQNTDTDPEQTEDQLKRQVKQLQQEVNDLHREARHLRGLEENVSLRDANAKRYTDKPETLNKTETPEGTNEHVNRLKKMVRSVITQLAHQNDELYFQKFAIDCLTEHVKAIVKKLKNCKTQEEISSRKGKIQSLRRIKTMATEIEMNKLELQQQVNGAQLNLALAKLSRPKRTLQEDAREEHPQKTDTGQAKRQRQLQHQVRQLQTQVDHLRKVSKQLMQQLQGNLASVDTYATHKKRTPDEIHVIKRHGSEVPEGTAQLPLEEGATTIDFNAVESEVLADRTEMLYQNLEMFHQKRVIHYLAEHIEAIQTKVKACSKKWGDEFEDKRFEDVRNEMKAQKLEMKQIQHQLEMKKLFNDLMYSNGTAEESITTTASTEQAGGQNNDARSGAGRESAQRNATEQARGGEHPPDNGSEQARGGEHPPNNGTEPARRDPSQNDGTEQAKRQDQQQLHQREEEAGQLLPRQSDASRSGQENRAAVVTSGTGTAGQPVPDTLHDTRASGLASKESQGSLRTGDQGALV